jgi:predicted HAD superfamily Cof-like phosphohydrolase
MKAKTDLQDAVDKSGDIAEFHQRFGLYYYGPPRALEPELQDFRSKFLDEELAEYKTAVLILNDSRKPEDERKAAAAKALDALIDLIYVAEGTIHLHGFNGDEAWRRVQAANMRKVRAERAVDSKRGSAFDVVKPPGWIAPDHSDLVADLIPLS